MNEIDVAQNLKQLRKKHGYTQQELANILKVAKTTVSTWERGAAKPRMDVARQLANLYGVTLGQLVGETNLTESKSSNTTNQEPIDLQKYAVDDSERNEAINAGGVPISDDDWEIIKAILSKYPRKDQ
ncbi:helix-turn-helix transcriptional regulator [Weissella paramesenteroides]|uniref:helix-turn-helix domain-containing protein n=1 Tax=Weissella paramesenteroides TaxID=1249 RepID=UPI0023A957C6|nr:helix-turn-helix transcriptional regulator [Weissella paramesenteroides]MDF8372551.1 helix-turn-helix transcriptional regulator [Weissella paramesenteroides]WEA53336.1 helix-turn-helix transcriptional regulator [Weissella paramesenteroides]WIG66329.1 helix-turn-helix transcriptional regulator [Weissella paramesenteroides]